VKHRKAPHRRKRYVIQLPNEDGSGVVYWNDAYQVWVEATADLQPTDPYSPAPTVYSERPNALAVCGFANAATIKLGEWHNAQGRPARRSRERTRCQ
jgi:hypothetical protein